MTYLLRLCWILLCLGSCTSSRFYSPNTVNLPDIGQKGEGALSAGGFLSSNSSGWEAQAAYSPLSHLALSASFLHLRQKKEESAIFPPFPFPGSSGLSVEGVTQFGEIGVGYYRFAGKQQEFLFSSYGLVGTGQVSNSYQPGGYRARWSYWRYALQPGVRLRHRNFRMGAAFRFSWVAFDQGYIDARIDANELGRIYLLEAQSPFLLWEMFWTIGYCFRPLTLSVNTTSVVLGKRAINDLELANNHMCLMLTYQIQPSRSEKRPK